MYQIDDIMQKCEAVVRSHALGNGQYARYLFQNAKGNRILGPNEYGTADAANILYTLNRFPTGEEAKLHADALKSFQSAETGLFSEPTHHPIHTTAHCVASLELFGEKPSYPVTDLLPYLKSTERLYELLDGLDWEGTPWPMSHQGAGIYTIGVLTDTVSLDWQRDYFKWIYDHSDPKYGLSHVGTIDSGTAPICHHLYGWFHYMFNLDYGRRPLRYPEQLIDSCLKMYSENLLTDKFAREIGFMEIDWVFAINRASHQSKHRYDEVQAQLRDFASRFIPYMKSLDYDTHDGVNDLHMLFGALCALAELQRAIPGEIESSTPLRLVLDRRPFI